MRFGRQFWLQCGGNRRLSETSGYDQFQQQSMGGFGQEAGYEPSADELIDVLK